MSRQTMPPVTRQKKKILGFFPRRQTIVFLVVFTLVGGSTILYQILSTRGANYSWFQTSWSGGASTTATASHDTDQNDWDKYYSKDANVSTSGGQLTLNSATLSMTDTADEDFNAGTADNVYIDNGTVKLKKPNGVSCASQDECTSYCGSDNICGGTVSVGMSYGGGIIFYLSGGHGLIAQTSDISTSAQWGCYGTAISGADSTTNGAQNTVDIVNGCSTSGIAARLCSDSTEGGYADWYLPAKDQLNTLYAQQATVGGFLPYIYWSSSEYSSSGAWLQIFNSGTQGSNPKSLSGRVRCIRSF